MRGSYLEFDSAGTIWNREFQIAYQGICVPCSLNPTHFGIRLRRRARRQRYPPYPSLEVAQLARHIVGDYPDRQSVRLRVPTWGIPNMTLVSGREAGALGNTLQWQRHSISKANFPKTPFSGKFEPKAPLRSLTRFLVQTQRIWVRLQQRTIIR